MLTSKNKLIYIFAGLVIAFLVLSFSTIFFKASSTEVRSASQPQPSLSEQAAQQPDGAYFNYAGESEKIALELLQKHAKIELDNSGLVVSINGKKADNAKREYWAFYVNGKMAEVGPAEYRTKTGDHIEWRIEKY